jgi:glycosyltransferase involved in cell wall biosynthesis
MFSIVFYPSVGGAQTAILRLCRKLRTRGVDALVVTRHHHNLPVYEEVSGVPTYRVGRGDTGKAAAAISFVAGALRVLQLQRGRYDVLHCHQMLSPMTIGLVARASLHKPLVINPHRSGSIGDIGILTERRPFTGRLRIAAARRWGDAFVSISDAIHAELRDSGIAEERIWDIPNGVDTDHFRPAGDQERTAIRRELQLAGAPLAIFAGRLVTEKGIDKLIDAWPRVLRSLPDAQLLLVGEGAERPALEIRVRQLSLAHRVRFIASQADVAPYLRAADAFVLPSYAEGMPIALLEAMACGLPCIATAVGGSTQLIDDGVTGRLVPPGDTSALAGSLIEALSGGVAERGRQARERIVATYSLDIVTDRHIELYEGLGSRV